MPEIVLNGATVHYQIAGDRTESVLFAHGLLLNAGIFDGQIAALQRRYRCISFDFRGHGLSSVALPGYDVETLYADTVGIIERLAVPCHFVGLSLGGIVGLRIAIRRPELLRSLALFSTTAEAESNFNKVLYRVLSLLAVLFGLRWVVGLIMPTMFGKTFLKDPARAEVRHAWRRHLVANGRLRAALAVGVLLNRSAILDEIHRITTPTLIVVGEEDPAIAKGEAVRIHSQIANSRLVKIPLAGHLVTVENPGATNQLLEAFFQDASSGSPSSSAGQVCERGPSGGEGRREVRHSRRA